MGDSETTVSMLCGWRNERSGQWCMLPTAESERLRMAKLLDCAKHCLKMMDIHQKLMLCSKQDPWWPLLCRLLSPHRLLLLMLLAADSAPLLVLTLSQPVDWVEMRLIGRHHLFSCASYGTNDELAKDLAQHRTSRSVIRTTLKHRNNNKKVDLECYCMVLLGDYYQSFGKAFVSLTYSLVQYELHCAADLFAPRPWWFQSESRRGATWVYQNFCLCDLLLFTKFNVLVACHKPKVSAIRLLKLLWPGTRTECLPVSARRDVAGQVHNSKAASLVSIKFSCLFKYHSPEREWIWRGYRPSLFKLSTEDLNVAEGGPGKATGRINQKRNNNRSSTTWISVHHLPKSTKSRKQTDSVKRNMCNAILMAAKNEWEEKMVENGIQPSEGEYNAINAIPFHSNHINLLL